MTIPEEIEQLKLKLEQTTDEREQAEVLLEMLEKYASINSRETQQHIDHLFKLAELLNEPEYSAWAKYNLAILKCNKGEYNASLDLCERALNTFHQKGNQDGMASCYRIIGIIHYYNANYDETLKNYFTALKIREKRGDKLGIAISYNNIGLVYEKQDNYSEALRNYFLSLKYSKEIGHKQCMSSSFSNIGIIYSQLGNYPESLKYNFEALKLREELGYRQGVALSLKHVGVIDREQGKYDEALEKCYTALRIFEEIGDKRNIAGTYNNLGNIYQSQGNFAEALKNFLEGLNISTEIEEKIVIISSHINIGNSYYELYDYPNALKSLLTSLKLSQEIGDKRSIANSYISIGSVYFKQANYQMAIENLLAGIKVSEEIEYKYLVRESSLILSRTYKFIKDFKPALEFHEKYHQIQSEMLGEQAQKQLTNLNFMHNMEQKEKDLEIEQLRNVELKKERDRSEALLLNILPAEVAEELKEKGKANAKLFNDVTVLFTDFKSFTTVSEKLTPQQLVDELNVCFSAFDDIMEKYNIEKIKTVGDAYLAVSGLPLACSDHASCVIKAAIEIRDFIKARKRKLGNKTFDIRIGVHSGSVVAGIVGVKKFAYDIWGDTVNTAARMEQNSEAGKINISHTTYDLVKDKFNCVYRGEIEAKNKGKLKMYFVN